MAETIPLPAVLPPNTNAGTALARLAWVLFGISTALVGARLYSKVFRVKRFARDDVLMLIAYACVLVYSVCVQLAYQNGFGRHYEYLTLPGVLELLKWIYIAQVFCLFGPMCGRAAVGFYLLAIVGKSRHVMRYWLWGFIAIQAVMNIALLITLYSACGTDIAKIGNVAKTCYRQSPQSRLSFVVGALNAVVDLFLTIAPTLIVHRVRTSFWTKCAAVALLSLSCLAAVAAIWRTVELERLFHPNWDFTHYLVPYFEAAALESNIIIIGGSIPTLGPIFKRTRNKGSTTDSSRRSSGDSNEIRYNLSQALGMQMPNLGNSVTITGGARARTTSEERILPLGPMPVIKKSKRTAVKVEYLDGRDEEAIEQSPPVRVIGKS